MGIIYNRAYKGKQNFVNEVAIDGESLYKFSKQQMKKYPHYTIGVLTAIKLTKKSNYLIKMTAAIVSPDLIITAAHSIFQRKQGPKNSQIGFENDMSMWSTYSDFKFFPAAYGQIDLQKGIPIKSWRFPSNYSKLGRKRQSDPCLDYALMKLQTPYNPKQSPRFLKPSIHCQACLLQKNENTSIKISGYPYSQTKNYSNYNPLNESQTQYEIYQYGQKRKGRIHQINQNGTFSYSISTDPGQSGSPIIFGQHYIGIHIQGDDTRKLNQGILFSQNILDEMECWARQMNAIPFERSIIYCPEKPSPSEYIQPTEFSLSISKSVSIKSNIQMKQLYLSDNRVTQISLNQYPNSTTIDLSKNNITTINLSNNLELTHINLNYNNITSLDLETNIKLKNLYLVKNKIQTLDVRNNLMLQKINMAYNLLTRIDLKENIKLQKIILNDNQLSLISFFYHHRLSWKSLFNVLISDQKSAQCGVNIFYHQNNYSKCETFIQEGINGFQREAQRRINSQFFNKHGCTYSFHMKRKY